MNGITFSSIILTLFFVAFHDLQQRVITGFIMHLFPRGDDLRGTRNRMILLLAYTALRRRSELTSLRAEDLPLCGDGQASITLRQSKTDQTREGVLLSLDIETTSAVRNWLKLAGIEHSLLLRAITGGRLNEGMDPGQISRVF